MAINLFKFPIFINLGRLLGIWIRDNFFLSNSTDTTVAEFAIYGKEWFLKIAMGVRRGCISFWK